MPKSSVEGFIPEQEGKNQEKIRELVQELFAMVQKRLGDADEINLGQGVIIRKIEGSGSRGWYEAGSNPYYVYENGIAERMDPFDKATLSLQIDSMNDEEWAEATSNAKMVALPIKEIKHLIQKFKKFV